MPHRGYPAFHTQFVNTIKMHRDYMHMFLMHDLYFLPYNNHCCVTNNNQIDQCQYHQYTAAWARFEKDKLSVSFALSFWSRLSKLDVAQKPF